MEFYTLMTLAAMATLFFGVGFGLLAKNNSSYAHQMGFGSYGLAYLCIAGMAAVVFL